MKEMKLYFSKAIEYYKLMFKENPALMKMLLLVALLLVLEFWVVLDLTVKEDFRHKVDRDENICVVNNQKTIIKNQGTIINNHEIINNKLSSLVVQNIMNQLNIQNVPDAIAPTYNIKDK